MDDARKTSPRTGRHSRVDVVDAALRILDENGLADLTMRRLAAALDVQPSALYWHFPNKQSLLAALADRIVRPGTAPVDPAADWAEQTMTAAQRLRQALLAHRDGAELISNSTALGLGSGAPLAWLSAGLGGAGLGDHSASRASTALLHFVLGHVSAEQQRLQYDRHGLSAASALVDTSDFAFGVTLLIEGIRSLSAPPLRP